jgi:hypothetical protein
MKLPQNALLKACFWSYRFSELDTDIHKILIIKQVLEFGDTGAVDWLEKTYDRQTIQKVISESVVSEWSKKTKNYLGVVYDVVPGRSTRFA